MYPVLATVSSCYSELPGRLSTRYSPVRHFTHTRRYFHVRLACVRHAASVQSEPESNSPVKKYDSVWITIIQTIELKALYFIPFRSSIVNDPSQPTYAAGTILRPTCMVSARTTPKNSKTKVRIPKPLPRFANPEFLRSLPDRQRTVLKFLSVAKCVYALFHSRCQELFFKIFNIFSKCPLFLEIPQKKLLEKSS